MNVGHLAGFILITAGVFVIIRTLVTNTYFYIKTGLYLICLHTVSATCMSTETSHILPYVQDGYKLLLTAFQKHVTYKGYRSS